MKVVVTGGAGFIGWSTVNSLIDDDRVEEVLVYDNFSRGNYGLMLTGRRPGYEKIRVRVDDILNSRGLREAFRGADCVCHLAALAPSPFSDDHPHSFDQVNHWGTAEVCSAVEDEGVGRIVYVSSGAVYGFGDQEFSVGMEPMPVTAYGSSKLAGERHVERLLEKRSGAILRSGTVYGLNPVARFDTFLNRFVLQVALGRPVQVHGSGQQMRPVLHVETLGAVVSASVLGKVGDGVHDIVEENVAVKDAVDALADSPLEAIFVNQQERMRGLRIRRDDKVLAGVSEPHAVDRELPRMLASIRLSGPAQ